VPYKTINGQWLQDETTRFLCHFKNFLFINKAQRSGIRQEKRKSPKTV
jgi:hypothetical protein